MWKRILWMYLRARRKRAPLPAPRMWSGGLEVSSSFVCSSLRWNVFAVLEIKNELFARQILVSSFTCLRVQFQKGPTTSLALVHVHTCREKHVCGHENCSKFSEGEEHYSQKGMKMNDCCNGLVMTTAITMKSSFQTQHNPINALICCWQMSCGVKDVMSSVFVFVEHCYSVWHRIFNIIMINYYINTINEFT